MSVEIITTEQAVNSFRQLSNGLSLSPAWQSDLPISDEVEQAMQELAEEIEAEAMLPWFLTEQAY